MGTLGNGNGGSPFDGGGSSDGVPDLPPEWGTVVIPDDPAELADEAAALRRELRRKARRDGWRRKLLPGSRSRSDTSLRVPAVIMLIAVLATMTSLFFMTWPTPQRSPTTQQTATTGTSSRTVPALELVDVDGAPVPIRGLLPAAILLTDGCACDTLIADTAAAARPGVTVITVTGTSAPPPRAATQQAPTSAVPRIRTLSDPTGELRRYLQAGPYVGSATVLLVDASGEILTTVPATTSLADFRADLAQLG